MTRHPWGGCRAATIDAVGVLQLDRVDGQLVAERGGAVGVWRDHIKPVDEAGVDLGVEMLPEVSGQRLDHVGGAGAAWGMWMRAN